MSEPIDLDAWDVWANRRDPEYPERRHSFDARCPFCRSGEDGTRWGSAHETGRTLIARVRELETSNERLRNLAAALEAEGAL